MQENNWQSSVIFFDVGSNIIGHYCDKLVGLNNLILFNQKGLKFYAF
jgi:hypothetical protein